MKQHRRKSAGFTMIESLIVLVILGVVVIGIVPAFLTAINRARMTTTAQAISALMYSARLEAIKRGTQGSVTAAATTGINGRVEIDYATRTATAYVDLDGEQTLSAGDVKLGAVTLGKDLEFHGPGAMATPNAGAVWSFASLPSGGGVAVFKSDGSVATLGAFRIRDARGNILEIRCEPQATAKVSVQKFTGDPEGADAPTDTTKWIRQDQGWSWN